MIPVNIGGELDSDGQEAEKAYNIKQVILWVARAQSHWWTLGDSVKYTTETYPT